MIRSWPAVVLAVLVSLMASFAVLPAHAQGDWRKLAERTVNGRVDRDVIAVGGEEGAFTSIQLKVDGSALEMFDVKLVFGNGESFSPNTRFVFGRGSWSREIDLPGERRVLKRVEFRYGNLPGGGSARVELWGRAAAPPPRAWSLLGVRTVNGGVDRDVVEVGPYDGLFTGILVRVDGSALAMFDIRVVFANGESFSPNTRLVFGKDETSRLIDLPGDRRVIKRVEFRYGNLPRGGNARVELWGRR